MSLIQLRNERNMVVAQIKHLSALATSIGDERSKIKFKVEFSGLGELVQEFKSAQTAYESALENEEQTAEIQTELEKQSDFSNEIFLLITDIKVDFDVAFPIALSQLKASSSVESLHSAVSSKSGSRNTGLPFLPRINLPTFDGDKASFVNFKDLFETMVVTRNDLSNVEKFQYLKMSLKGEPLQLIRHLPVSSENFESAWELIQNEYYKPRVLRAIHFHKILNIPKLTSANLNGLKSLLNTSRENIAALNSLNVSVEKETAATFIVETLLSEKLDSDTRKQWELSLKSNELPTLKEFHDFLFEHVSSLEAIGDSKPKSVANHIPGKNLNKFRVKPPSAKGEQKLNLMTSTGQCELCKGTHPLHKCQRFLQKSSQQRFEFLKGQKRCIKCFKKGHFAPKCLSKFQCSKCDKPHHILLHFEPNPSTTTFTSEKNTAEQNVTVRANVPNKYSSVLLPTVLIDIRAEHGGVHTIRALMDTGSQDSYITADCANMLGLTVKKCNASIVSIGEIPALNASGLTKCHISPHGLSKPYFEFGAIVVNSITSNLPQMNISEKCYSHLKHLHLADPDFMVPGKIDMLLSSDIFVKSIKNGKRYGKPGSLSALNTVFGWVVMGDVNCRNINSPKRKLFKLSASENISDLVARFWELEDVPKHIPPKNPNEVKAETISSSTVSPNRVAKIQELAPTVCWSHVASKHNAADVGSRGLMPLEFETSKIWFNGPEWLLEPEETWPISANGPVQGEVQDKVVSEQSKQCFALSVKESFNIFERSTNYIRLLRIMAYCLRFIDSLKKRNVPMDIQLKPDEILKAKFYLVKVVQQECFPEVFKNIEKGHACVKEIQKLSPFVDHETGVIRVGGRLRNSDLSYDQKFPLLLPANHQFTSSLINYYHKLNNHLTPQALLSCLSSQFWILAARRAIRKELSTCIKCFKRNPITVNPIMGDLPKERVNPAKAFQNCGVDYGGPYKITMNKGRGKITLKAYICLFVCFATKAIHLELASDLSTEKFLEAFVRFIGRRGRVSEIYSDCGTNFVGANKYLTELQTFLLSEQFNQAASEKLSLKGITWNFNPPSAPHFGGLWEAGIKSTKRLLHQVLGEQLLTYEEFYTLLVQVEAILNSRPLYALSADPADLQALTPGHFLVMEPLIALPAENVTDIPIGRLSRWQLLQSLHQHFWKRWKADYLNTLQQRNKWVTDKPNLKINDLVTINDSPLPPTRWRLGRITELLPGSDGVARVAKIMTQSGTITRPVVKLHQLPLL